MKRLHLLALAAITLIAAAPRSPVTIYPSAEFSRIACTPGPIERENPGMSRLIDRFVREGERGIFDPHIVDRPLASILGRGYFARLGGVRSVAFLTARHTCDAVTAVYRVEGHSASRNMTFSIRHGRIAGTSYE